MEKRPQKFSGSGLSVAITFTPPLPALSDEPVNPATNGNLHAVNLPVFYANAKVRKDMEQNNTPDYPVQRPVH